MEKIIHSRLIRWLLLTGCFFLFLLTCFRIAFHFVFVPQGENGTIDAFLMGLRYDARAISIFLLVVFISSVLFFFKPFSNKISRKILMTGTILFGCLIIVVYTFDFAHFAYLRQRLNASILSYSEDAGISATMIWQSYPVIKIILGWVIGFFLIYFISKRIYQFVNKLPEKVSKRNHVISYIMALFIFALSIFGRLGQFPLRWSDAYQLNSDYKANLALNPFQTFVSSMKYRHAGYDKEKTKQYYPLMASVMGLPKGDTSQMVFDRIMPVADSLNKLESPNIVLVICESFSAYKSSMWGNPLNTTPYFNQLCKEGVFFKNCFSPAYGTARGIWAIITGIPDVTEFKTASRNPNLVDQQSILNELTDYEKFYFLGGSASWANIRGVLKDNIKGLHLYEEPDYSSPKIDVWGISDKNLFLEANKVLKKQSAPFFAIIQTADNHRPYTIPKEDKPFIELKNYPKDTLEKYGFWTNEEMNAYAYMDYTYKVFMEAAAKEKYFNNTIFVFVGDHGIRGVAGDMMPKVWTEQGLTLQHVPLLFYAPGFLKPQVVERKVSQVDIMPSITGLLNRPVLNTTMGRNVFSDLNPLDSDYLKNHAFLFDFDQRLIGLVGGNYYYQYSLQTNKEGVYSLKHNNPLAPGDPPGVDVLTMRNLTLGYFETARYLLYHNKKKKNRAN